MSKSLIIKNPLVFMNEAYFKKKVLIDDFESGEAKIIYVYDIPSEIIITFPENNLCSEFIKKYNDNFFEEEFNYKLQIEEFNSTFEKEQEKLTKNLPEKTPFFYHYEYEKIILNDYENSNQKSGLIYHDEEKKKIISEGIKYLIKKFGQNLIQGKSVLSISLPVFLFDKRTLQEVFCYELRAAPYYLTHAYYCTDKMERLKWITVLLISICHVSCFQTKPFNPIIGETFQCKIGSLSLYTEQTVNHPCTANFYGVDDEKRFKIYGHIIADASIGLNSVSAQKLGKFYIEFKDGQKYRIRTPPATIEGYTMGERLYNYVDRTVIEDLSNNYVVFIVFNPDKAGFLKSLFSTSQNSLPDTIRGYVYKKDDVEISEKDNNHEVKKNATSFLEIEGGWSRNINFDGDEYWDIEDNKLLNMYPVGYSLPSDGRKRLDYIEFAKDNVEKAQVEKEKLEVLQRNDRKLRKEWMEKNKK